ncbi:tellurite resistance TerB family protein [Rhodobacteraceae bacterium F11138]|nr:tellurite resistance TerB family protein [Rhodobacteraceae bacterium F11138]
MSKDMTIGIGARKWHFQGSPVCRDREGHGFFPVAPHLRPVARRCWACRAGVRKWYVMGLFSRFRKDECAAAERSCEVARSVLSMPFLIAAADGRMDDTELHQILNISTYSPIFLAIGVEQTLILARDIMRQLRAEGPRRVFDRAAASLDPDLRETALCFAIRIALADGRMGPREQELLVVMARRLDISEFRCRRILEVIAIMQRPAT